MWVRKSCAAWAEALSRDDEFGDDPDVLHRKFVVHDDKVLQVAEGRWYGSLFLGQPAGRHWKAAEELHRAAACLAEEHELMWDAWAAVGGHGQGEEQKRAFAKPDVRRKLVDIICRALAKEAEAATWIERAFPKIE